MQIYTLLSDPLTDWMEYKLGSTNMAMLILDPCYVLSAYDKYYQFIVSTQAVNFWDPTSEAKRKEIAAIFDLYNPKAHGIDGDIYMCYVQPPHLGCFYPPMEGNHSAGIIDSPELVTSITAQSHPSAWAACKKFYDIFNSIVPYMAEGTAPIQWKTDIIPNLGAVTLPSS